MYVSKLAIRHTPSVAPIGPLFGVAASGAQRCMTQRATADELKANSKEAAKRSPFAHPETAGVEAAASSSAMSREEEQKQRVQAMADMMREKTLREVSAAGASRRPHGVKHMLDLEKQEDAVDAAVARTLGPQYAANYDSDRDEWGGPKGEEPTRFGDWEVSGRASDF